MESTHAKAAAMIRAEMKRRGWSATVRSRTASMMTAIDVDVYADLAPTQRDELTSFVGQFEFGHFDGMDDSYHYSNRRNDIPQVKYAHVTIHYSDGLRERVRAYIRSISGIDPNLTDRYEWMALQGTWGDFWNKGTA